MLQADLAGHQDGAPTFVLGVYDGQQDGTAGTFVVANASQPSVLDGDGLQFIQIGQRAGSRSLVSAGWITIAGASPPSHTQRLPCTPFVYNSFFE